MAASMLFQFCLAPAFANEEPVVEDEINAEETVVAQTNAADNVPGHWVYVDGDWYYKTERGDTLFFGTYLIDDKSYLFIDCIMQNSGWVQYAGHWYYCYPDGHLASGWEKIGNHMFYFIPYEDGNVMLEGFASYEIDNKVCYFDENGHWLVNTWYKNAEGRWYYFDKEGAIVRNDWAYDGGKWYYFDENGNYYHDQEACVQTDEYDYDFYYFDASGAMVTNKWINYYGRGTDWKYFGADGKCAKGWFKVNGIWYYGVENWDYFVTYWEFYDVDDVTYYFDQNNAMVTGWFKRFDWDKEAYVWYYADGSGAIQSAKWIGDYYLAANQKMVTNAYVYNKNNNKYYWVDSTGKYIAKWTTTEKPEGYDIYIQQTGKLYQQDQPQ